jgi:hypothetical protein
MIDEHWTSSKLLVYGTNSINLKRKNLRFCVTKIGGASEKCKNLTIPLFCPNGTALFFGLQL